MNDQLPTKAFEMPYMQVNNGPGHATIVMPINFEGSNSLKAESVFVNLNSFGDYPQVLNASKQGPLIT